MRKSLLFAVLILCYVWASSQTFYTSPSQMIGCPGGYAIAHAIGDPTHNYWQISHDGGQTWTTLSSDQTEPEYGNDLLNLAYHPVLVTDDGALFRFCYNGNNSCSMPDTLYVNSGRTATPVLMNPPSTVCAGNSVQFTATGGAIGVTNDSISWAITINGATIRYNPPLDDSTLVINFPSTATGNATITLTNFTGFYCGSATSTPATVAIQPASTSLAGTAGAPAACTDMTVYPGGQPSYYSTSDPAETSVATDASCNAIAAILPSGSNPVAGAVTSCVTLASTVPSYNGIAYVPRYYNLEPSVNAGTSTATITLYFMQADFDAYNAARGSEPALPTGPTDATGIANLTISQFHGTGTTPDTYVGTSGTIIPTSVVWNSTTSLWSVTFSVTGFSGFFVSGTPIIPLPLTLTNFDGQAGAAGNQLTWQTASEENTAYFEVQRAIPGTVTFEDLGRVAAAGNSSLARQYNYTDALASTHPAYSYRLKMVDEDGRYTYSPVVILQPAHPSLNVVVAPNPFVTPVSLTVGSPVAGAATVVVLNMNGARLVERSVVLAKGDNALDVSMIAGLPQGVYFLQVTTGTQQQTAKFVKE